MKTDSHMHDYDAHVRALDADLEYYYTKRLLPLAFQLFRKRYVELADYATAYGSLSGNDDFQRKKSKVNPKDYETRIRGLEDSFDEFVRGINRIGPGWAAFKDNVGVLVDDVRKERGDYDEFFHFAKSERNGSLDARIRAIDEDLKKYNGVLRSFTYCLRKNRLLNERTATRLRGNYPSLLNGSRIVARAWADDTFRDKLLLNAREAVRELSIPPGRLGQLQVVENTDKVHNVIVCTLCSCYPYDLLGNAPYWYKQDSYKTRIVSNPRKMLKEMFHLEIPSAMELRVHDSTSDVRYMVLPRRPKGTEKMGEGDLAKLVTRASLIGAGEPLGSPR